MGRFIGKYLLLRQDLTASPNVFTTSNWLNKNKYNTTAKMFSRLEDLNNINIDMKQSEDNKYLFYLCYPNITNAENPCIVFKQSINPLTITSQNTNIEGFELIKAVFTTIETAKFSGLRSDNQGQTLLNGSANHEWWYAVSCLKLRNGKLPSLRGIETDFAELYLIY